jgi:hypothetical protein
VPLVPPNEYLSVWAKLEDALGVLIVTAFDMLTLDALSVGVVALGIVDKARLPEIVAVPTPEDTFGELNTALYAIDFDPSALCGQVYVPEAITLLLAPEGLKSYLISQRPIRTPFRSRCAYISL